MLPHLAFVEGFGNFLRENHPDCCFYIYGSVFRGSHCEESDVDGGIILDSGVVTDKTKLHSLATGLALSLAAHRSVTQLNVIDRQTALDGRFLSYGPDHTDHIKSESRVISGPDFRFELNGMDYRSEVLRSAAFNLRSDRNLCLVLEDLVEHNPDFARERVLAALDHAIKYPKHLLWLITGKVIIDLEERKNLVGRYLPKSGVKQLERLRGMKTKLFNREVCPEDYFSLHVDALDLTECMIGAYLEEFPEPSKRESLVVS